LLIRRVSQALRELLWIGPDVKQRHDQSRMPVGECFVETCPRDPVKREVKRDTAKANHKGRQKHPSDDSPDAQGSHHAG
jgi:hypothetical protein